MTATFSKNWLQLVSLISIIAVSPQLPRAFAAADAKSCHLKLQPPLDAVTFEFPESQEQVEDLFYRLEKSVYAKQIARWKSAGKELTLIEKERLWRMAVKNEWRHADKGPRGTEAEVRMKFMTNQRRRLEQVFGLDESADPSAPFVIGKTDPKLPGMPEGVYSLSSGKSGFIHPTMNDMLRNGKAQRFEIEFQHRTPDGRIVIQQGGYADAKSSWGWDGRFVYQPDGQGGYKLMITQGCMELPSTLRGSAPGAQDLPEVAIHNNTRNRHIFTPIEWIPAAKGKPARLIVRDEGSILRMKPSVEGRWVEFDSNGNILHAHGYGENFIPDPKDPRKMWVDEEGYSWRIFDMVTKDTALKGEDGRIRYVPTETRSVAYRMDPNNPSKVVPAGVMRANGRPANEPVFFTSNHLADTGDVAPATERYAFDASGTPVEERSIGPDGKVTVITENVPAPKMVLNEGNNPAPGVVVPKGETDGFYVLTGSAGEYTSGGLSHIQQVAQAEERLVLMLQNLFNYTHENIKETDYGVYVWTRPESQGRIGEYSAVLTQDEKNLLDQFQDITRMYGLSWGIGRPQVFMDDHGQWWLKGHGVDVDLLARDIPQSGYPATGFDFAHKYRRQQILVPIEFIKKDQKLIIQIRDRRVLNDLKLYRERMQRLRMQKSTENRG